MATSPLSRLVSSAAACEICTADEICEQVSRQGFRCHALGVGEGDRSSLRCPLELPKALNTLSRAFLRTFVCALRNNCALSKQPVSVLHMATAQQVAFEPASNFAQQYVARVGKLDLLALQEEATNLVLLPFVWCSDLRVACARFT